jgi:hypothetical protein
MVVSPCHEGLQRSCSHSSYEPFVRIHSVYSTDLSNASAHIYVLNPQDYSMQPPNQDLIVRDLHDNMWTFRHIYRGRVQHYLTWFPLSSWIKTAGYLGSLFLIPPLHLMFLAGQPKRHLLTTGWSLFVGAKRLKAGDSVLFIRYASKQLV